jgi:hypothetical protein
MLPRAATAAQTLRAGGLPFHHLRRLENDQDTHGGRNYGGFRDAPDCVGARRHRRERPATRRESPGSGFARLAQHRRHRHRPRHRRVRPHQPARHERQLARGASAGASASGFDRLDRNRDGFVSRDEARDANELNTRFTELDQNNDGKLSRDEYNAINRGSAGATSATRGTGDAGGSAGGTK